MQDQEDKEDKARSAAYLCAIHKVNPVTGRVIGTDREGDKNILFRDGCGCSSLFPVVMR